MALVKLDAYAVGKMSDRVKAVQEWLRDLQTDMLRNRIDEIELNTGNFELYFGNVEEWQKSAEARKSKVFRAEDHRRAKIAKGKAKAAASHEAALKRKKSS